MALRVVVVARSRSSDEIESLAGDQHVWAIRTPEHEAVAERIWASNPVPRLEAGITLFNGGDGTPEDAVVSILSTVDEHHGVYSHDPPLSVIEVIGAAVTPDVRIALEAYDFARFEEYTEGFVAYRV